MSRLAAVILLSLAAHAGLLLGIATALGVATPRMLFVDLVEGFGLAAAGGSGGGGSSGAPGAPKRREPAGRRGTPAGSVASRPRAPATSAPRDEPSPAQRPPADVVSPSSDDRMPDAARPPTVIDEPGTVMESAKEIAAPGASEGGTPGGGSASDAASGTGDAASREKGLRTGQGSSGRGGELGGGVGAGQGSVVARGVPGDGGAALADYDRYYALLRSRLHAALKYPSAARRRGLSGTVEIEVHVAPSGEIQRAAVVASSTHRLLDEAALEAAQGLRVPFLPGLPPATLRMRLPVVFDLRDQP